MVTIDDLTASQEDYLEAIFHISEEKKAARAKDISVYLNVKAASVTGALRNLGKLKLINYAPYDLITLTDHGRTIAEEVVYRHKALEKFLIDVLGIEKKDADAAACKMEHHVPKAIIERLVKYGEYVEHCPRGGVSWESGFGYYCKHGCTDQDCERCMNEPDKKRLNV